MGVTLMLIRWAGASCGDLELLWPADEGPGWIYSMAGRGMFSGYRLSLFMRALVATILLTALSSRIFLRELNRFFSWPGGLLRSVSLMIYSCLFILLFGRWASAVAFV